MCFGFRNGRALTNIKMPTGKAVPRCWMPPFKEKPISYEMLTKVTSLNTECPWSLWRFPWLPSSRFGKFRKGPVWFHPAYVGESKTMLEKLRITMLQVSHGLDLWHFWSCNSFHKLLAWHKFGTFLGLECRLKRMELLKLSWCFWFSECLSGLVCSCFYWPEITMILCLILKFGAV